jgi:hypothetical protein
MTTKPVCPFGAKCYRKNPAHFKEYSHVPAVSPTAAVVAVTGVPRTTILFPVKRATPPASPPVPLPAKVLDDEDGLLVAPPSPSMSVEAAPCATPPSRRIPSAATQQLQHGSPTTKPPAIALVEGSPRGATRTSAVEGPPSPSAKRGRSLGGENSGVDWTSLFAPPPQMKLPLMTSTGTAPTTVLADLFGMPYPTEDLLTLLTVARSLCPRDPLNGAFPGWRLVGPMEVLAGVVTSFSSDAAKWRYGRFRYDPPEVQTIAVSTNTASSKYTHVALHRDDPHALPTMIVAGRRASPPGAGVPTPINASGAATVVEDRVFDVLGDTVGGVFLRLCEEAGPAGSASVAALTAAFPTPKHRGKSAADTYKLRKKAVVASTVHHLGVVVPYDRKTELGYRPMMMTLAAFQSLISAWNEKGNTIPPKQLDAITEQFQWADIANDECDFGLNLEIGLNLFSLTNGTANDVVYHTWRVLEIVYGLLNRDLFRHILKCHLAVLGGALQVQWKV